MDRQAEDLIHKRRPGNGQAKPVGELNAEGASQMPINMPNEGDRRCADPTCNEPSHGALRYCHAHLIARTITSCETMVRIAAMEVFVATEAEVDQARMLRDLAKQDSLTAVELLTTLEALTDTDISEDDLSVTYSAREYAQRLSEILIERQLFKPDPNLNVAAAHLRATQSAENALRQVRTIINSALFKDYMRSLGYTRRTLQEILTVAIGRIHINHVFTVPSFVNDKLEHVQVFILTKVSLVYIRLEASETLVQSWPKSEVSVKYCLYHSDPSTTSEPDKLTISKILVQFILGTADADQKTFEFWNEEGINGALSFYEKLMQTKGETDNADQADKGRRDGGHRARR